MTRLHDSLAIIDGLVISKWSRAVFADMRPQTPAKAGRLRAKRVRGAPARASRLERDRGFADSPLEGDGFEPSVPRRHLGRYR